MLSFRSTTKNNEVIAKKTVSEQCMASLGACGRLLAVLNIDARRQLYPSSYIYISVICRITMRREEFLTNFYHCGIRTMLNCT